MEKRHIASLGADVSLLGFGCMRLPLTGKDSSKIDYAVAQKMIDTAYKAGVNYYDTAWPYHEGASEVFVGDTMQKYPRESFYLATKMPTWEVVQSKGDVEKIFGEQFKKLKTDYIDFYLVHSLDDDHYQRFKKFDYYNFFMKQKEAGKIRHLGFSFHAGPELLEEVVKNYKWDFVQIQLNYLDWEMLNAQRFYEFLTTQKLPVIVMEPVRGGALAKLNDKAAGILKKADGKASLASWAIRFAASLPNVMTVLSGMSTPEQVEDNLAAMKPFKPLSDNEKKIVAEAAAAYKASGAVPCTGCRYCMDCPSGVDIPRLFSQYNYYKLSGKKDDFLNTYRYLKETERADKCINCGACVKLCPQSIDIPARMKEIAAFAAG
jgi:predicted aldo/keto reductase-like oxidoreductase